MTNEQRVETRNDRESLSGQEDDWIENEVMKYEFEDARRGQRLCSGS